MLFQTSLQHTMYEMGRQLIVRHVHVSYLIRLIPISGFWYSFHPHHTKQHIDNLLPDDMNLLNKLTHANNADHLSGNVRRCLRGTRTEVLRDIEGWAEDRNNGRVYWLNGVAGCRS